MWWTGLQNTHTRPTVPAFTSYTNESEWKCDRIPAHVHEWWHSWRRVPFDIAQIRIITACHRYACAELDVAQCTQECQESTERPYYQRQTCTGAHTQHLHSPFTNSFRHTFTRFTKGVSRSSSMFTDRTDLIQNQRGTDEYATADDVAYEIRRGRDDAQLWFRVDRGRHRLVRHCRLMCCAE
jgi:hypothetical protein